MFAYCILSYVCAHKFVSSGSIIKNTTYCVDCVGLFGETRDKGFVHEDDDADEDDSTLVECQKICIDERPYCFAIDYKDGKCFLIWELDYSEGELIENVGNVHSVLKPCDAR